MARAQQPGREERLAQTGYCCPPRGVLRGLCVLASRGVAAAASRPDAADGSLEKLEFQLCLLNGCGDVTVAIPVILARD